MGKGREQVGVGSGRSNCVQGKRGTEKTTYMFLVSILSSLHHNITLNSLLSKLCEHGPCSLCVHNPQWTSILLAQADVQKPQDWGALRSGCQQLEEVRVKGTATRQMECLYSVLSPTRHSLPLDFRTPPVSNRPGRQCESQHPVNPNIQMISTSIISILASPSAYTTTNALQNSPYMSNSVAVDRHTRHPKKHWLCNRQTLGTQRVRRLPGSCSWALWNRVAIMFWMLLQPERQAKVYQLKWMHVSIF